MPRPPGGRGYLGSRRIATPMARLDPAQAMQRRGIIKKDASPRAHPRTVRLALILLRIWKEFRPTTHPMHQTSAGLHSGEALGDHFDVLRLDRARENATQPRMKRDLDKAHNNALTGPFVDPLVIPEATIGPEPRPEI